MYGGWNEITVFTRNCLKLIWDIKKRFKRSIVAEFERKVDVQNQLLKIIK